MKAVSVSRDELRSQRRDRYGKHIKKWRIARGVTKVDLSISTGLGVRYIQQVEAGVVDPTANTLKLIVDALDAA